MQGLLHVAAVVPAVGAEFAFWKSYRFNKIINSLEFQCGKLKVLAHCVHHLLVLLAVWVCVLCQQFVGKILGAFKVSDDSSCVKVERVA